MQTVDYIKEKAFIKKKLKHMECKERESAEYVEYDKETTEE